MKRKRNHLTTKNNHYGNRFPKNHKVHYLKDIDETLMKIGRPSFIFDPKLITNDRTLDCWGLPKDNVMKIVLSENLNLFMDGLKLKEQEDNKRFSDVEKLFLFSKFFDTCVKEGTIMEKYNLLSEIDCLLDKIISETDNSLIEKIISQIEVNDVNV